MGDWFSSRDASGFQVQLQSLPGGAACQQTSRTPALGECSAICGQSLSLGPGAEGGERRGKEKQNNGFCMEKSTRRREQQHQQEQEEKEEEREDRDKERREE